MATCLAQVGPGQVLQHAHVTLAWCQLCCAWSKDVNNACLVGHLVASCNCRLRVFRGLHGGLVVDGAGWKLACCATRQQNTRDCRHPAWQHDCTCMTAHDENPITPAHASPPSSVQPLVQTLPTHHHLYLSSSRVPLLNMQARARTPSVSSARTLAQARAGWRSA